MPDTLEAAVILLILAVPGYLALQRYNSLFPVSYYRNAPTTLGEIGLYVSLSVLVNVLVVVIFIVALVILVASQVVPDPTATEIPNEFNNLGDIFRIVVTALIYLIIAYPVVLLLTWRPVLEKFLPPELPLWWEELAYLGVRQQLEPNAYWVQAQFREGGKCLGAIKNVRWVGDQGNAIEFVLDHTFYWRADMPRPEDVGRMLFNTKDIIWLGLPSA